MAKKIFNIGDKVAVIDDTIKGMVVLVAVEEITIEDENGFLFKYAASELVQINNEELLQKIEEITLRKELLSVKKKKGKNKNIKPLLEVDLHIHQITKSNKGMDNYTMLTKQLSIAKQKLEFAIKTNIKKVVFIHGIGKGVLKKELYQLLKKYAVEINDASYQKYGYGATEVTIYKKTID